VRNGMIYCTGFPTGALRTTRQYENFILEVEWRHLSAGGNSGVFIWGSPINAPGVPFLRGIEVQALDHGYATQFEKRTGKKATTFTTNGDVFPIHGATMKPLNPSPNGQRSFPMENRSKASPEWNHYRIVANNGSIRLHVNGKEVSGGDNCVYRKGYLALESEGAPIEFRNVRIKELPSSNPPADVVAPVDQGWRSLFNGLDLRGWKTDAATATRWEVAQERLAMKPALANATVSAAMSAESAVWTDAEFGAAEFIVDYSPAKTTDGADAKPPVVFVRGNKSGGTGVALLNAEPGKFSRFVITVEGRTIRVKRNDGPATEVALGNAPARGQFGIAPGSGSGTFMNLLARDL
jgi:hypothetical protein